MLDPFLISNETAPPAAEIPINPLTLVLLPNIGPKVPATVAAQPNEHADTAASTVTEVQEKKVVIYHFKFLNTLDEGHSEFEVKCGPGTYVRTLANDLAIKIGTFAHTSKIMRVEDSFFNINKAFDLEMLMSIDKNQLKRILSPVDYVLKNFKEIELDRKYLDSIQNGKITFVDFLEKNSFNDKETVLIKNKGKLVSIANLEKGYIIPQRNFNN